MERKTWHDLKPVEVKPWHPMFLRHPDAMDPLCGLTWLADTMHVIPEWRIEVSRSNGTRHSMVIKDAKIINKAIKSVIGGTT